MIIPRDYCFFVRERSILICNMSIKIAIIDDKAGNRQILKDKLMRHGQFEVVLMAGDGKEFMDKMKSMADSALPEVALMDLEMPNMDGVDAIAVGSCFYPQIKFVVLTIFDDDDKIFKAIKAGAFGYLLKDEPAEQIVEMLWQMHENDIGPISPGIAYKILQLVKKNDLNMPGKPVAQPQKTFFDLTQREREILQLLIQGLSFKEIGTKLSISAHTAKKHVMNIYNKLHVNSRAQALHLAYEKGIL